MRTQQELTALGEVLKTYQVEPPKTTSVQRYGHLFLAAALLIVGLILGQPVIAIAALLPLGYSLWQRQQGQGASKGLSITLHQKGVNPIHPPHNKAWLYEDIEYNYLFHTGETKPCQPYNNLAFRKNDQSPWFVIPAEMPGFTEFLRTYQTLHYEYRFPKLLKKIMQGKAVPFCYVTSDAVLVRSLIDKTFDTPTKTLTLSQQHITIDGEAHELAKLTLSVIDKQKNFIALSDDTGRLIFGNDTMGLFNHVLFIDLLIHLMSVQKTTAY
ncbi:MAG: hypothetical protein KBC57_00590 [Neisseriaceae bacterium]|nr:hypothetical protein [Neisseriaceae bacterium]MBP6860837.1 hypothetical protein [Neisseriaceae bacterium]